MVCRHPGPSVNAISASGGGEGGLGRVESTLVSTTLVLGHQIGQFPCIHACQGSGLCDEGRMNIRDLEQVVRKALVWGTSKVGPEARQEEMGTIALRGGGWGAVPRAE